MNTKHMLAVTAASAALLAACHRPAAPTGPAIALLLPENKTTRYEAKDRPMFEARVKALCPDCTVLYFNAAQDAAKQQQQAEAALTQGAKVLVLDPVDSKSAAVSARLARQSGAKVISYERLILDAPLDAYISFDNEKIGELQAQTLIDNMGTSKQIVMINGSPTDHNAALYKQGAHAIFDANHIEILKEYDTPDWSPDKAQAEMEQAITALGKDKIGGVYAANDGTAGGAIAALKGAGLDPSTIPVTGQDAEIAAIQRLLLGQQYMTVYKAIRLEADAAAQLAVAMVKGQPLPAGVINGQTANGAGDVPSVLLTAVAVTWINVKKAVFDDGFVKKEEVCTGEVAQHCQTLDIR